MRSLEALGMRPFPILACVTGISFMLAAGAASAGAVSSLYGNGIFGLPWSAKKDAIQTKYPGGKWDQDDKGRDRYCVTSKQNLLKLPTQYDSRELCFLIGTDGTLGSGTAVLNPTLQSLLAIVNRCRTTFGDFDAVVRDPGAIQSRFSGQLWTRDKPFVVMVRSDNDADGAPVRVTYTVADESNLYTEGSSSVSNVLERK
jgi:hypothetical protein